MWVEAGECLRRRIVVVTGGCGGVAVGSNMEEGWGPWEDGGSCTGAPGENQVLGKRGGSGSGRPPGEGEVCQSPVRNEGPRWVRVGGAACPRYKAWGVRMGGDQESGAMPPGRRVAAKGCSKGLGHVAYGTPRCGQGWGWGLGGGGKMRRTLNSLRRSASLYILLSSTSAMMAFLYTAWSASRWDSTYLTVGLRGGCRTGRGSTVKEVAYDGNSPTGSGPGGAYRSRRVRFNSYMTH